MDLTTDRAHLKLKTFAAFAKSLGELSTCKKRKVGAILCDDKFTEVIAIGYNGPPVGKPNDSCCDEPYCGCAHAETNCLIKPRDSRTDLIMICSLFPCERCATLILNSRAVSQFIYLGQPEHLKGLELLADGGVRIYAL